MNVRNIYRKLRQGKTLTGDECAVLEAYERQAAPEPGQALHTPTCAGCHQPLDRTTRAGHKVWYVCRNLMCEKNQRQAKAPLIRHVEEYDQKQLLAALTAISNGKLQCPTGYRWTVHLNGNCKCGEGRQL